jgi:hypothetical protein
VTESISEHAKTRGWRGTRRILVVSEQAKAAWRTIDDARRIILFDDPIERAATRHLPDDVGGLVQILSPFALRKFSFVASFARGFPVHID